MYCASVNYWFFSYQWLSWNQPGPNSIQWETIQNAFGLYCKFIAHCILSYQWLSWNQPGPNSIQWEFIQISSRYVLRMFQLLLLRLPMALVKPTRPKQYPMGVYPDFLSVCVAYVSATVSSATNGFRETNLAQTVSDGSLSIMLLMYTAN